MILKLSDIFFGQKFHGNDYFSLYPKYATNLNYPIFRVLRINNYNTIKHQSDLLSYYCDVCGGVIDVIFWENNITGCRDDGYPTINDYDKYPQICHDCYKKAREMLGLKGEAET